MSSLAAFWAFYLKDTDLFALAAYTTHTDLTFIPYHVQEVQPRRPEVCEFTHGDLCTSPPLGTSYGRAGGQTLSVAASQVKGGADLDL